MTIPLSQINKKNPYYETLKKVHEEQSPTSTDWKILKVQLAGIYFVIQTITLYLKIKKKLKGILNHYLKKSKKS